jgi:dihydrodipicolinate synthase/N-acetylneuraminate lyase
LTYRADVASHLSREERRAVVATGRKALDQAGFKDEPLLVGTGGGSAVTTIELTEDAAAEGATHSIVICPGEPVLAHDSNAR